MKCQELSEVLADYLGGELGSSQGSDVQQHLDDCPICRAEVTELRRVLERLERLPAVGVERATGGARELPAKLRGRAAGSRSSEPGRFRPAAALRYAAVLALGVWLGYQMSSYRAASSSHPQVVEADRTWSDHAPMASAGAGGALHPCWLDAARELPPAQRSGGEGSLATQLALLSRPGPCR